MIKPRFFIYLIFIVISTNLFAQENIDSVGFVVRYPESYLKPYAFAGYFKEGTAYRFELEDTANYDFSWAGSVTPERDTIHFAIYDFGTEGNYNIDLIVFERATGTTFNYSRNVIVALPVVFNVPNVFSPNNDGINDLFKVFYNGDVLIKVTIFTRTGTQVFEAESPSVVWDGRNSSGSEMSEGVYYYVIESDVLEKAQTGFVHLYRNE